VAAVEEDRLAGHEIRGRGSKEDRERTDLVERPVRRIGMSRVSRSPIFGSSNAAWFISVTNHPGAIAFTWTLWRAHSTPSVRVSAITPPFVAP
jgi:hypothetical protein